MATESKEKTKPDRETIIRHYLPYDYPPEWMDYVKSLNLAQRIHGAMCDIGPMKKDRMMDGGQQRFAYHSHVVITAQCKAVFEKWRLSLTNTVLEEHHEPITIGKYETKGFFTTARVRVRLTNIDDPADFAEVDHVGYGQDTSDKGIGKAVTYASKYALMKLLMISDGEEPDNESIDWDSFDQEMGRKTRPQRQQAERKGNTRAAATEAAREAMQAAQDGQGKPVSRMTPGEIFAAIVTELKPMGESGETLKAFLKNHDGATSLDKVPRERLETLYSEARAKAQAFETLRRAALASGDPEGAEARMATVIGDRSAFAVTADELYREAEKIRGAVA